VRRASHALWREVAFPWLVSGGRGFKCMRGMTRVQDADEPGTVKDCIVKRHGSGQIVDPSRLSLGHRGEIKNR
jgi:hypothetical protein